MDLTGAGFAWPVGSFLRLGLDGSSGAAYARAAVHAGRVIQGLEVVVPSAPCVELNSSASGEFGEKALDFYEEPHLEVVLHVAAVNASIFLGPSLQDGYEINLEGLSYIRRVRFDTSLGGSSQQTILDPGTGLDLWLSWQFLAGEAVLRVYDALPEEGRQLLSYFDAAPPAGYLQRLWVGGEGSWQLCPTGASRPQLASSSHPRPLLKLVEEGTTVSECGTAERDVAVGGPWPLELTVAEHTLTSSANFSFLQGGLFNLCYNPDASNDCLCSAGTCRCTRTGDSCSPSAERPFGSCNPFAPSNSGTASTLLFAEIAVQGVSGPSSDLAAERWDCFFRPGFGSFPCRLLRAGWVFGSFGSGAGLWGAAFGEDTLRAGGGLLEEFPTTCGSTPAAFFDTDSPLDFHEDSTLPAVRWDAAAGAFTAPLCFCAGACSAPQDFVQAFGRLYMWVVHICDRDDATCDSSYMQVLPQQSFVIKIFCPPGGACTESDQNQLKIVQGEGDRANWDSANLCQVAGAAWSGGSGGVRVDVKVWATDTPRLLTPGTGYQVCYCNGDCDQSWNWIEVGRVRTLGTLGLASTDGGVPLVTYVNKPGSFTMYAGVRSTPPIVSPYDSNMFEGQAALKLISLDREVTPEGDTLADRYEVKTKGEAQLAALHQHCQGEELVAHSGAATNAAPSRFLAFGELQMQAGTVAVCYCGLADCSGSWLYVGLLQLRGPRGGQTWVLPTKRIVALRDVQGWGFHVEDKLRLAADSCEGSVFTPYAPQGTREVKVGCPFGINSSVACGLASATELLNVQLADNLRSGVNLAGIQVESASSSILTFTAPVDLQNGDAIYIEPNCIRVNGQPLASMSATQRFDAMRLAGTGQFQDDVSKTFLRYWHHVELVEDGGFGASKVRIPVGWPQDSIPAFSFASGLQWYRSNTLNSQEELKVDSLLTDRPVCWAPNDDGEYNFYGSAGTVSFTDPPELLGARVALTARGDGEEAPILISFVPSRAVPEYRLSSGQMLLVLRFLNTDILKPTSNSTQQSPLACGRLFRELWSDAPGGFPVPVGCWLEDLGANGESSQRELFILFERLNGLRSVCPEGSCSYQMVLEAAASGLSAGSEVLELEVGCSFGHGDCERYQVYERGAVGFEETGTVAPGASGFQAALETSEVTSELRLRTSAQNAAVQPGTTLRLFLAPFTQWNLGPSCASPSAGCVSSGGSCGTSAGCAVERVLPGVFANEKERYAILKLQLPDDMDPILDQVSHTFVAALSAASGAFFPTRAAAEVATATGAQPRYVPDAGLLLRLDPSAGSARFMVSGRENCGPQPFAGQRNLLYAQIMVAATTGSLASLEITPPPGFACDGGKSVPGPEPTAELLRSASAAFDGDVVTLQLLDRDLDGFPDVARNLVEGTWQRGPVGSSCLFRLADGQKLYAGQALLLALEVLNPSLPSAAGAWSVSLASAGDAEAAAAPVYGISWNFSAPSGDLWTADLPVLAKFEAAVLQPSAFEPGAANRLSVFFVPSQDFASGGILALDAPLHFGLTCPLLSVANLPALPGLGSCGLAQSPQQRGQGDVLNRLEVPLSGYLRKGRLYGFQLQVTNPQASSDGFFLWLRDASQLALEGSEPLGLLEGQIESWQIAEPSAGNRELSAHVAGGFLRPFSAFGVLETLMIQVRLASPGWLSVLGPPEVRFQAPAFFARVEAGGRQLIWAEPLEPNMSHVLEAAFQVAEVPDIYASSRAFFLELRADEKLVAARAVAAPAWRQVEADVRCSSRRAGDAFNVLTFHIHLSTPITQDGVLVIQADHFGLVLSCPVEVLSGSAAISCSAGKLGMGGLPAWLLRPQSPGDLQGWLLLAAQASNPKSEVRLAWTIGSFHSPGGDFWHGDLLDAPVTVLGCPISEVLPASLLSFSDARPHQRSEVAFTFQLPAAAPAGSLLLRAPPGYVVQADCSRDVFALAGNHSGLNHSTCLGDGSLAELPLPEGLPVGLFGFGLAVTNPSDQPALNWWSLEVGGFGNSLEGYPLAQIRFPLPLRPVNQAFAAPGTPTEAPVGVFFVLQRALWPGAKLRIWSPQRLGAVATWPTPGKWEVGANGSAWEVRVPDFLAPGFTHGLYVLASNPAEQSPGYWMLETISPDGQPLDQGQVETFTMFPAAGLSVVNQGTAYSHREVRVRLVAILPSPVLFGDVLLFEAPLGFLLADVQWEDRLASIPPAAELSCAFGPCSAALSFVADWKLQQLQGGVAFAASLPLALSVASVNPGRTPAPEESFWRLTHLRDTTLSTAVVAGWPVLPELRQVQVSLLGPSYRAGAAGDLLLSFVAESSAVAAVLVAHAPGVAFDGAEAASKDAATSGPTLVLSGLSLVEGLVTSIVITSVRLGQGGRSIFSLQTFEDRGMSKVADERLHFEAFFQAGAVEVEGTLQGHHSLSDPLLQNLPARAGEWAEVSLRLSFSLALAEGGVLLVTSRGLGAYLLSAEKAQVNHSAPLEAQVSSRGDHVLEIRFSGNGTLIEPGQWVELKFQAVPTALANTWQVDTYHQGVLSNTNDGTFQGFRPVVVLEVELAPRRSPPGALIEVQLKVSASGVLEPTTQLTLVAPEGFSLPPLCGESCVFGEPFEDTLRPTAAITGSSLFDRQLLFKVNTPLQSPQVLTWLVQAWGPGPSLQAWGLAGFKVNQMRDAQVLYGGVPGLQKAELAFVFTVEVEEEMLRIIEVNGPAELSLDCAGAALRGLALPGPLCAQQGPGFLRLELGTGLSPGTYAFTVQGDLPAQTPVENSFSVLLKRQPTEHVVDAAFGLPGWPTLDLQISQPLLAWSTASAAEISKVTVSFAVQEASQQLRALLISLPDFFQHRVRSAAEFKVSNPRLPLLQGAQDWLDVSSRHRIVVNLEPQDPEVAIGTYMFTFPVALPGAELPAVNLWRLSLCSARCATPTDKAVLLSFAMAGFLPGEVSLLEQRRQQLATQAAGLEATGAGRSFPIWRILMVCFLVFT
ncbi:unnamed protein product [Effrenium voratum]|uniref:Uncharacterized protein n=1 Tax=Effrenium voratum TaxID=2562239 RepID=A0AA36NFS8_9DINO|nr:unnamed protein product [Effrenium voratum]